MNDAKGIRIALIIGTVRPGSYTKMAVQLVADYLIEKHGVEVDVIDPAHLNLNLPGLGDTEDSKKLQERVTAATGVVLSTPEYHGSVSAACKLVIENLGFPSVLKEKPIALLGVAAGRIGAIKSLEQLRGICGHVGAIALPGVVSVAQCRTVFASDGSVTDEGAATYIRGVGDHVMHYLREAVCPGITLEAMVREGCG